ncbi:MAG: transcriptional regulator, LuxR family, partial [Solirubrobacteraceae bacterium]|nr:transcriptional regulator, LuxR family [Solirubrobacteraceae bacterium]
MNAPSPITVAIAHFEDLLALGLRSALQDDASVTVVATDIAPARIAVMLRAHRPRVLVLDVDALRDLAQIRKLSLEFPQTRIVALGQGLASAESAQVLAFGASAYLAKGTQARDLRNAIHLASRGLQLQLMPVDAGTAHAGESQLTPREGDVLVLLRQDRSNGEIAQHLQIGIETVRSHARNIYRKLGVSSRRALLALPVPVAAVPAPVPGRGARRRA